MKRLLTIILATVLLALPVTAKVVEPAGTTATTSGTITAGARALLFVFSSDFTGTISGVAWSGATDASYSPPVQTGDTFAAITYTVTTGSVRIIQVR